VRLIRGGPPWSSPPLRLVLRVCPPSSRAETTDGLGEDGGTYLGPKASVLAVLSIAIEQTKRPLGKEGK
jgi:hypothetical protein